MKHLSEEELIEHYYEESIRGAAAERHLKVCTACARSFAELRRDLDGVKPPAPPTRGEGYGEQVWQSIRGSLPIYETPKRTWTLAQIWKPLSLAAACALLIVAAFFAGRQWQRKQTPRVAVTPSVNGTTDPQVRQRVVIVVLGDHLDRSERLLVELNHADDDAAAAPLQSEARELLATSTPYASLSPDRTARRIEWSLSSIQRIRQETRLSVRRLASLFWKVARMGSRRRP